MIQETSDLATADDPARPHSAGTIYKITATPRTEPKALPTLCESSGYSAFQRS